MSRHGLQSPLQELALTHSNVQVRQNSVRVWKSVVFNTPRTLGEILQSVGTSTAPSLSVSNSPSPLGTQVMTRLFDSLSSDDVDRKVGSNLQCTIAEYRVCPSRSF